MKAAYRIQVRETQPYLKKEGVLKGELYHGQLFKPFGLGTALENAIHCLRYLGLKEDLTASRAHQCGHVLKAIGFV